MSNAAVELEKNSLNCNYFISGMNFSDHPCSCLVSYNTKHYRLTIHFISGNGILKPRSSTFL